jgi:hypothetical protein
MQEHKLRDISRTVNTYYIYLCLILDVRIWTWKSNVRQASSRIALRINQIIKGTRNQSL